MLETLAKMSFDFYFWFAMAFVLGCLQMMTDEFFFGGASIGALLTATILWYFGPEAIATKINWSMPYVICGAGGLVGAIGMRCCNRNQQNTPDINEEPYEGEDR